MKRRNRRAIAFSAPGQLPRYTRARRDRIDVYRCAGGCLTLVRGYAAYCDRCSAGPLNVPPRTSLPVPVGAWVSGLAIVLVLLALATLATSTRDEVRAESVVLQ